MIDFSPVRWCFVQRWAWRMRKSSGFLLGFFLRAGSAGTVPVRLKDHCLLFGAQGNDNGRCRVLLRSKYSNKCMALESVTFFD